MPKRERSPNGKKEKKRSKRKSSDKSTDATDHAGQDDQDTPGKAQIVAGIQTESSPNHTVKKKSSSKKSEMETAKQASQSENSVKVVRMPSSSASKKRIERPRKQGVRPVFLKKKVDFLVSLLPGALRNCEDAVERSIGKLLLKYSPGLGGILMAHENVRFKRSQGRGWILNENPEIHFDVSCDALVFRPSIGCELQGVVNECFPSHLGILVFNYFNAMVSADQLQQAGYSFDRDLHNWVSGDQTISNASKIHFLVQKIHECEGTISLEGTSPSLSLLVEPGVNE